MMGTRVCALLVAVLAGTTVAARAQGEGARRTDSGKRPPNFVLILMDDMGWKDLGVTGSLYHRTPNIDRIARAGMIFDRAYSASPLCSPSRGALLSGKAPARTALTNVIQGFDDPYGGLHEITKPMEWPNGNTQYLEAFARHVLPLEEVTIAEALAEGGYVTGYYGKWHVGQNANFQPDKQGFRHASTLRERDGGPATEKAEGDVKWVRTLTGAAVRFIEEQKEHPFFLMIGHYAMHRPLEALPDLVEKYRARPGTDQGNPVFAALLESVDESVGTIDATLARLGLQDDTVFIFASDNGGLTLGPDTSNYPLLGGKSFPYEAGMRTPLFIRWPSRVRAGSRSETRVIHMDLYPTLLEMAGLPLRPDQHLDGRSLMPLLSGGGDLPERDLHFHFPHPTHATGPFASIISEDWKLIRWYNDTAGAYSLFNLADDPGELADLADRLPGRVEELSGRLARWQRETRAQMPLPNPRFDPSLPPLRDKAFTRRLAMKEREEFERRLEEYEGRPSSGGPAATGAAQPPRRPNVVILVADDLGWADLGYHGAQIATPNIDRLARQGVRLEGFRTAPLCSPTRAGLMTGRFPIRYGMGSSVITPWRRWGLPTTEHTVADLLAQAGYGRRGAFGKWHLGHYERRFLPLNRGFTRFYGHYNGYVDYFTHEREGEIDWHVDFATSRDQGYATDLIGREAAAFVSASSPHEPFFLYVAFSAPHGPLQAKPEDVARYAHIPDGDRRTYAAMVDSLDQAVGRVLAALEAKGVAHDTFVLFFSDNGAVSPYGDNGPWRGEKGAVYEGGVRVPAVARWPAGFEGGREVHAGMGYIDVYPTVKRMAGLSGPDPNPLDGLDMLDVIRGAAPAPERDWFSYIAQGSPEAAALQDGVWKLVVSGGSVLDASLEGARAEGQATAPSVELFRLDRDPGEQASLVAEHPEVAARLLERLQGFRRLEIEGVPGYRDGREGFEAPKEWTIPR